MKKHASTSLLHECHRSKDKILRPLAVPVKERLCSSTAMFSVPRLCRVMRSCVHQDYFHIKWKGKTSEQNMHILVNRVYNTKKQANNPLLPKKSIHILINTFTYIHYYFLNTTTLGAICFRLLYRFLELVVQSINRLQHSAEH